MKRYLSLSFALLALFLAACNGPLPSTDSTPASSVASASTPSPSESTDAEEQPADAPQETLPADLDWQPYEVSTFASLSQTEGLTDVSEFSPAGEIRPLLDLATVDGYSTAEGFYRFVPREDASSNLCYIDFASGQEIYLCSQPNCAHADASCTSWYPSNLGILLPIPVGDRLVVLHGGSPSYASLIGDDALAQIEFAALDGSGRSTGIVSLPTCKSPPCRGVDMPMMTRTSILSLPRQWKLPPFARYVRQMPLRGRCSHSVTCRTRRKKSWAALAPNSSSPTRPALTT